MKRNSTRFYRIDLRNHSSSYELEELIKEFLRPDQYELINSAIVRQKKKNTGPKKTRAQMNALQEVSGQKSRPWSWAAAGRWSRTFADIRIPLGPGYSHVEKNIAKRYLFDRLSKLTGYRPEWGTLTGVRPTKLANEMAAGQGMNWEQVRRVFEEQYYVSEEKTALVLDTCRNQSFLTAKPAGRSAGVYIGIPFCPTRCLYCSFTSNQANEAAMEQYLQALLKEIRAVGAQLQEHGVSAESIYIGGGTPTSLSADALNRLLDQVCSSFDTASVLEFCTEAGRPDTITAEKLRVLKEHGVDRISINPQSMNDRTLEFIGRSHCVEDIYKAFEIAMQSGIPHINTDIIAGLPGEDYAMFLHTLQEVMRLGPDNITVHTLAVKRASRLREKDSEYHYSGGSEVGRMVGDARKILGEHGYFPYYMYRQKHMTGNFENVSYAKKGTESVYNIRIMDEHQTIIAMGAGGISKAFYGDGNKLERVPNVSNYQVYIDRIDEMIQRKDDRLYLPFE